MVWKLTKKLKTASKNIVNKKEKYFEVHYKITATVFAPRNEFKANNECTILNKNPQNS